MGNNDRTPAHRVSSNAPNTLSTWFGRSEFNVHLRLEGEAGADLVGGLVQLLGVEGGADAEGDALVDLGVVGDGGDTAVVDLGL